MNVDELCILFSHFKKKSWSDDSSEGLLASLPKAQSFSIIPAGEENGIVPNALLTWISAQARGDYRYQMNNNKKWAKKIILNLHNLR
jgi:hypothetical protein